MNLAKTGAYETVSEAYNVGVNLKFISPNSFYPMVHALIIRFVYNVLVRKAKRFVIIRCDFY